MWKAESRALVGDFGAGQALSDEQYALLAPLIPPPKPGGRPRTTDMRRLLDGLFYLVRTGCQWRHLPPPPAFPPGGRCTATCEPSRAWACGRACVTSLW
jgi:putative transposase